MAATPPEAVRGAQRAPADLSNKLQSFKGLGPTFRSLLAAVTVHGRESARGPLCGPGDQSLGGHFEPSALASHRGSSEDAVLVADVLDPLVRSLAAFPLASGPAAVAPNGSSPAGATATPSVADVAVVEEVVRRIAWGGDRRVGIARIELGGAHSGTAIVVRGSGRELSLSIELGRGADAGALPERLVARLQARGLAVTSLEVR